MLTRIPIAITLYVRVITSTFLIRHVTYFSPFLISLLAIATSFTSRR